MIARLKLTNDAFDAISLWLGGFFVDRFDTFWRARSASALNLCCVKVAKSILRRNISDRWQRVGAILLDKRQATVFSSASPVKEFQARGGRYTRVYRGVERKNRRSRHRMALYLDCTGDKTLFCAYARRKRDRIARAPPGREVNRDDLLTVETSRTWPEQIALGSSWKGYIRVTVFRAKLERAACLRILEKGKRLELSIISALN